MAFVVVAEGVKGFIDLNKEGEDDEDLSGFPVEDDDLVVVVVVCGLGENWNLGIEWAGSENIEAEAVSVGVSVVFSVIVSLIVSLLVSLVASSLVVSSLVVSVLGGE